MAGCDIKAFDSAIVEGKMTPRVVGLLERMVEFLVSASRIFNLAEPEAVATMVLLDLKGHSTIEVDVEGEKKVYSSRFVEAALALSLRGPVTILSVDDQGRADQLGIDPSVLDKYRGGRRE